MPEGGGMVYRVPTRKPVRAKRRGKAKPTPIRHAPRKTSPEGAVAPKSEPFEKSIERAAKKVIQTPQVKKLAKTLKGKRIVKRAKTRHAGEQAARVFKEFEALKGIKPKKSRLDDILEEIPAIGQQTYDPVGVTLQGSRKKDKDTKILGFNVEAELEGRGKLRDVGETLKRQIEKNTGYQTGGIAGGKYSEAIAKDLVDVAANAPASAYAVAAGLKEASAGRPKRLKQLGKQVSEHDPLVLALRGKPGRALKEIEKHPGFALLEASGVGAAASRGAGAVARSGAIGPEVRRAASTRRAPKVAPGTNIEIPQRYSKGVVGKAGQKAVEGRKVRKAKGLYREAGRARGRGDVVRAAEARAEAQQANPFRVTKKELRRRYDRREGLAESRRRAHRDETVSKATAAMPEHQDIGLLLAQKIVKPTRESLEGYLKTLDAQFPKLRKAEKVANQRLRKQIRKALDDEKLDLPKLAVSADRYADLTRQLQRSLVKEGVLPKQAERWAKLVPVAVREMKAEWNPTLGRLELAGEKLTAKRIETFLRSTGRDPKKVAFVSQHPSQTTAGAFYQAWQSPKGVKAETRTGEATRRGTFDVGEEAAGANVARMQGLIDAAKEYGAFVKEFGHRKGKKLQTFKTRKQAEDAVRTMGASGVSYEWTPVAIRPTFGKGGEQAKKLLEEADSDVTLGTHDAIESALRGEAGAPRYVLVPADVADQMRQHMRVLDPTAGGKALRQGTQQFKNVVLTTAPTWATGNVMEASLRSFAVKAGPRSYQLGKRTLAQLQKIDPKLADELTFRLGSGHFGMQELQAIHTTARQFQGTAFGPLARALGTLRRTPGPKQLADAWNAYTRFIYSKNGLLEHQFKVAMLGRYAKDFVLSDKALLDLEKAAKQAAQGLKGTNEQFAAAEWVRRQYGAYEGFSPSGRRFKAQYTPFAAWTMNATRFLLDVMPRDHPVATGLLASAQRATEQWQKDMGLDIAPGWLKGAIPAGKNWFRVGRYTPFSLAGDPLGTYAGMVLPQFNSVLMNMRGMDWKGAPLADKERAGDVKDGEKLKAAVASLFSVSVPIFSQGSRAQEKGGGALEKLTRTLNPFNPIERQDPKVSRAFQRSTEIRELLDGLPALDESKPGSAKWKQRKKLNAEQARLQALIGRLSHGEFGTTPSKSQSVPSGGSWVDEYAKGKTVRKGGSWVDQYAR